MQHPCSAAGQSLHLLVAQPHGSQAQSAGAAQDRDPQLAQGAEGSFGVCGVPARLSPSSHRFIHSHPTLLWAARPGKQALFGFSLRNSAIFLHPEESSHKVILVHSCPMKLQHHPASVFQGLLPHSFQ